jgi:hypothetical protein
MRKFVTVLTVLTFLTAGVIGCKQEQPTDTEAAPNYGTKNTGDSFSASEHNQLYNSVRELYTMVGNAESIQGVPVNNTAIGNGKVLKYNSTSNNLEYQDDLSGTGSVTQLGDVMTTTPLHINGGSEASNILPGTEADYTLSVDNAAADDTTKGVAAFNAADFNSTNGVISIDRSNFTSSDLTFDARSVPTTAVGNSTTSLNETTSATDSGAYLVGVYDEFANSNGTNVQSVLHDLDAVVSAGGSTNATSIQGTTVDATDIANGRVLAYNSTSGNLEYEDQSGSGITNYVKTDEDSTVAEDSGVIFGSGEGAIKVEGYSASSGSAIVPYNGGSWDYTSELGYDATADMWRIEGKTSLSGPVFDQSGYQMKYSESLTGSGYLENGDYAPILSITPTVFGKHISVRGNIIWEVNGIAKSMDVFWHLYLANATTITHSVEYSCLADSANETNYGGVVPVEWINTTTGAVELLLKHDAVSLIKGIHADLEITGRTALTPSDFNFFDGSSVLTSVTSGFAETVATGGTTAKKTEIDTVAKLEALTGENIVTSDELSGSSGDASSIQGTLVDATDLADGKILKYDSSSSSIVYADDNTGATGDPVFTTVTSGAYYSNAVDGERVAILPDNSTAPTISSGQNGFYSLNDEIYYFENGSSPTKMSDITAIANSDYTFDTVTSGAYYTSAVDGARKSVLPNNTTAPTINTGESGLYTYGNELYYFQNGGSPTKLAGDSLSLDSEGDLEVGSDIGTSTTHNISIQPRNGAINILSSDDYGYIGFRQLYTDSNDSSIVNTYGMLHLQTGGAGSLGDTLILDNDHVVYVPNGNMITYADTDNFVTLNRSGAIEISDSDESPFIDLKTSGSENFDIRMIEESNGLGIYTGGDGSTALSMTIGSDGSVVLPRGSLTTVGDSVVAQASGAATSVEMTSTGNIELTATSPVIDLKNSASDDYDSRLALVSNGITVSTGGNGSTAAALVIDSSQNVDVPNGNLTVASSPVLTESTLGAGVAAVTNLADGGYRVISKITGIAGASITIGQAVYMWYDTVDARREIMPYAAGDTDTHNDTYYYIGIALGSASAGSNVTVWIGNALEMRREAFSFNSDDIGKTLWPLATTAGYQNTTGLTASGAKKNRLGFVWMTEETDGQDVVVYFQPADDITIE